jgi:hypothetical protein
VPHAEHGEADKCRDKFHIISPPDVWLEMSNNGFVALLRFNATNNRWPFLAIDLIAIVPIVLPARAFQSVVSRFRTARPPRTTKSSEDGGFDEDDVMVAVSLPVVVLASRQAPPSED